MDLKTLEVPLVLLCAGGAGFTLGSAGPVNTAALVVLGSNRDVAVILVVVAVVVVVGGSGCRTGDRCLSGRGSDVDSGGCLGGARLGSGAGGLGLGGSSRCGAGLGHGGCGRLLFSDGAGLNFSSGGALDDGCSSALNLDYSAAGLLDNGGGRGGLDCSLGSSANLGSGRGLAGADRGAGAGGAGIGGTAVEGAANGAELDVGEDDRCIGGGCFDIRWHAGVGRASSSSGTVGGGVGRVVGVEPEHVGVVLEAISQTRIKRQYS